MSVSNILYLSICLFISLSLSIYLSLCARACLCVRARVYVCVSNLYTNNVFFPAVLIKVSLVSRGSYVKYKSRYQDSHPRIVWTDTMTFDLPKDQLHDVNLVFTVKQTITLPETKKVVVVGRLVIGAQNCSQKGQQQWNKMLLNPREAQAEWHTLI